VSDRQLVQTNNAGSMPNIRQEPPLSLQTEA